MPGALLMCIALVVYGLGTLDLVKLLLAAGLHLVIGIVYLVAGAFALVQHDSPAGLAGNPFAGAATSTGKQPQTPHRG